MAQNLLADDTMGFEEIFKDWIYISVLLLVITALLFYGGFNIVAICLLVTVVFTDISCITYFCLKRRWKTMRLYQPTSLCGKVSLTL